MSANAEPNVVPLCDILLVLLIIFMVITPMSQKGMDVKLPETSAESGATPIGLVVMTLMFDLTVDINKTVYPFDQVEDELRRIYSARQDKTIFIRAYANVPFYKVIELIDIAKGAGVDTTGLIPEYIEVEGI
jgi:biopolymer transport protein TolR